MGVRAQCDFLLFGATGMQGKIVLRDLVEHNYKVFISAPILEDLQKLAKKYPVTGIKKLDLKDKSATVKLIKSISPKVVINCAEGDWNLNVYNAALKAGSNVIDLGSDIPTTVAQLKLDQDFKKRKLVAITGCGSTPGINNVMLSRIAEQFDEIESVAAGFA